MRADAIIYFQCTNQLRKVRFYTVLTFLESRREVGRFRIVIGGRFTARSGKQSVTNADFSGLIDGPFKTVVATEFGDNLCWCQRVSPLIVAVSTNTHARKLHRLHFVQCSFRKIVSLKLNQQLLKSLIDVIQTNGAGNTHTSYVCAIPHVARCRL
jgi:hypothetical protein